MTYYDVFNGDADGICSLLQLRQVNPVDSVLVTGVKRDIALLDQVTAGSGDQVTVLDISMEKNLDGLNRLLGNGVQVFYVDHHFAGSVPESRQLTTIINEAPDICTSLLVNQHLQGACASWAVVGAFGDNLKNSARSLARKSGLSADETRKLEELGIYINYNGYGSSLEELHFKPDDLYRILLPYDHPLSFIHESSKEFALLRDGYSNDMDAAWLLQPEYTTESCAVYILPDAPWARRVGGVFGNDLANQSPDRAHAVVTEKADGHYQVSVRAPLNRKSGAADLCRQFVTGGGRAAAAGINHLPAASLEQFVSKLVEQYL
ncbi:acetyltransferase [Endozoicomonas montiporae]|uniref:Acetyltransferase n=2 Tax=Endozoicomonas montiporae TaxID=1027273 RepID=A0A081N720_9GAMM|nr:acetyltransferase [Endozoicomonas montiporae]AMO55942.1 acetyltransferase [Endozoicomonas montiporae CL-33]KEQ14243.1 acetyltransferase [Endozoicomonas montiporae]